jgi:hypothetical protein
MDKAILLQGINQLDETGSPKLDGGPAEFLGNDGRRKKLSPSENSDKESLGFFQVSDRNRNMINAANRGRLHFLASPFFYSEFHFHAYSS